MVHSSGHNEVNSKFYFRQETQSPAHMTPPAFEGEQSCVPIPVCWHSIKLVSSTTPLGIFFYNMKNGELFPGIDPILPFILHIIGWRIIFYLCRPDEAWWQQSYTELAFVCTSSFTSFACSSCCSPIMSTLTAFLIVSNCDHTHAVQSVVSMK